MKRAAIIPARYASSRFPGKPLAVIKGKPMLAHVIERVYASGLFSHILVATDHEAIHTVASNTNLCTVVYTGQHHVNGSSRCLEAYENAGIKADYIINVQGDEPAIQKEQLEDLCRIMDANFRSRSIGTLRKKITDSNTISNPNVVKVVCSLQQKALYFSRSAIPFVRDMNEEEWTNAAVFYKHIGIYGYSYEVLKTIMQLPPGALEQAEQLEQLRWLEHGYSIFAAETKYDSIGVDTPDDIDKVKQLL
jgi:3-deoxy-manno-octulosonate cytidylyltransferase (CMP-KDO synthetase)